ncbi:MAG: type VII toxin-antitoxin system HepT family RNase toxin [Acidimicrobiales bacterium]
MRRLLEALGQYRARLDELRRLDVEEYVTSHAYEGRYLVQACAQLCIDLGNHLISSEGWRIPADFRDTFTVLQEQQVLGPELAGRLRDLAGLRNRLVHLYTTIDDALVHGFLAGGITDLDRFAQRVTEMADARSDDAG